MARVAVLHNTLDFQGGADVVCLNVCAALEADHRVTLFTISETEPATLAERFGVDIGDVDVRTPPSGRRVAGVLARAAPRVGPQLALRSVLLRWFFDGAGEFDLAVSTANELSVPMPSVQYVHYPQFHRRRRRRRGESDSDAGSRVGERLSEWTNEGWSRLAAPSPAALASDAVTLLANSEWTADAVADTYGVRPAVLYPPVDPIACESPWNERENGVVTVGRLAPDKRMVEAIEVVDAVRERGHDVHLHVVGSAARAYRRYAKRVAEAARSRPYVTLERDVSRERLETLLCTHKYGLNMKEDEHFGMSVAEYVAAGMVAFAHDSGGQREILEERTDRLFASRAAASERLADAIEADEPPLFRRERFATRRFATGVRRAVERTLDRCRDAPL